MAGIGARRSTRTIAAAVALGVIGLLWAASAASGVLGADPNIAPDANLP